jgi:hypothetical protein
MRKGTRMKCRQGTKSVNATCVVSTAMVTVELPKVLHGDISFAKDYLMVLPERIREVEEAAEAVLKAGRGR